MRRPAPAGSYRSALRVPEFAALAGSSLISILGDSAAYLAATVLVYQRTASPLLSALTFAIGFLPYLFGGTLLASLVDRLRPKHLLVGFDLAAAALVAITASPSVPVPAVFVVLFVIGMLGPMRSGTSGALVASILPGDAYAAGRSVLRICAQSAQIAGAGLGGALVAAFGPHGALLADGGSFVISATVVAVVVKARPATDAGRPRDQRPSLVADSLAGIRGVWAAPGIRRLLLLGWLVPFVAVAPEGLAAPAVTQAGHPELIGVWLAAIPVGTVIGDLLVVWTIAPRQRKRLTWPLAFALTVLLVIFAAAPSLGISVLLLTLIGAASAYGLGLDLTLRDDTPPVLLARMYTLSNTGLMTIQGLGFVAAGALGQFLPAHDAIAVAGAVGLLVVPTLALSSRLRPSRT
jgi:MFS family permease